MTVRELVAGSLRLIGAIASGEVPSASEQSDALLTLNDMIESWSTDGLMIYETKREVFSLTPSQQTYTMGVGGNLNSSRPMRITSAAIINGTNEIPIAIVTVDQWAAIGLKNTLSPISQMIYPEGSFPLEKINLWPIPNVANSLVLYSIKPLAAFASAEDNISLPPGYSKALRYNLAIELCPEYGREPSPVVVAHAEDSKANIKRQNLEPIFMVSDAAGMSRGNSFNWLTGE